MVIMCLAINRVYLLVFDFLCKMLLVSGFLFLRIIRNQWTYLCIVVLMYDYNRKRIK